MGAANNCCAHLWVRLTRYAYCGESPCEAAMMRNPIPEKQLRGGNEPRICLNASHVCTHTACLAGGGKRHVCTHNARAHTNSKFSMLNSKCQIWRTHARGSCQAGASRRALTRARRGWRSRSGPRPPGGRYRCIRRRGRPGRGR